MAFRIATCEDGATDVMIKLSLETQYFLNINVFKMDSISAEGHSTSTIIPSAPKAGFWGPAVTFFDPDTDELATSAQAKYSSYLSKSGLTGPVILGTNAETLLLTCKERKDLLSLARHIVGPDYLIITGVSGHSATRFLYYIADPYRAKPRRPYEEPGPVVNQKSQKR